MSDPIRTVRKILTSATQMVAFPILASLAFCLLSGIPFITFWSIVFRVVNEYAVMYVSWFTPDNIVEFQKWFRQMVFGG